LSGVFCTTELQRFRAIDLRATRHNSAHYSLGTACAQKNIEDPLTSDGTVMPVQTWVTNPRAETVISYLPAVVQAGCKKPDVSVTTVLTWPVVTSLIEI